MNFNTNNTGTGTNSRASSQILIEYPVKCRYCGAEKKYKTSIDSSEIKPKVRCECRGKSKKGLYKMHREWKILGNGLSNNDFIPRAEPSIDNVFMPEQSINNQILALPNNYPNINKRNRYSEKLRSITPNPNPKPNPLNNEFELSKPSQYKNDNLKEFCKICGKPFSKEFKGLKNSHEEYCQAVCPPGATWNNISKKNNKNNNNNGILPNQNKSLKNNIKNRNRNENRYENGRKTRRRSHSPQVLEIPRKEYECKYCEDVCK